MMGCRRMAENARLFKRLLDADGFTFWLIALAFVCGVRARDAWHAMQAPDIPVGLLIYVQEASLLSRIAPLLLGALLIIIYVIWIASALSRTKEAGDATIPSPSVALLHHFLPPFCFFRPFNIITDLLRSVGEKSGLNDLAATLWWGGLWAALVFTVLKTFTMMDQGIPTSMTYFAISLTAYALLAISALSLAWIVSRVSKGIAASIFEQTE